MVAMEVNYDTVSETVAHKLIKLVDVVWVGLRLQITASRDPVSEILEPTQARRRKTAKTER